MQQLTRATRSTYTTRGAYNVLIFIVCSYVNKRFWFLHRVMIQAFRPELRSSGFSRACPAGGDVRFGRIFIAFGLDRDPNTALRTYGLRSSPWKNEIKKRKNAENAFRPIDDGGGGIRRFCALAFGLGESPPPGRFRPAWRRTGCVRTYT